MSRNKGRTKASSPAPAQAVKTAPTQTIGLSYVAPTEFVELPSRGQFYSVDHPLHNQETIELRFMTAKDEDILTSRSLLKKGVALERLIDNLLVDKRISARNILVGDRNAIIIAARSSGYGNAYETSVTCPQCGVTSKEVFDLDNPNIKEVTLDESLDITKTENGYFATKLPHSGYHIEFRLLTGKDERMIDAELDKIRKLGVQVIPELTTRLRYLITSVDGNDEQSTINSFVENMLSKDSLSLRQEITRVTPDIDLSQEVNIEGETVKVNIPMTVNFFWPNA